MNERAPEVSVIIPAYNCAEWIGHALQSVFAQTYRNFEVIIIDDGSNDDLERALARWRDRIAFERQNNAGPGSARNRGLRLARGRLVAFLDADDEWLPEKLALQVAYFDRYPETGLLHTALVGDRGDAHTPGCLDTPPTNVFCDLFHTRFFIRTLSVMAPRTILLEAGGFDERREIHVEDWDLWLRIAARHAVGYLPRPLGIHRKGGYMSMAFEKTYVGQALVIENQRHLCAIACAEHRASPQRCLSSRWHTMYWELGYERFQRGDRVGARQAFAQALSQRPGQVDTLLRYGSCFVPEKWVAAVRALRAREADPRPNTSCLTGTDSSGVAGHSPAQRLTIAHDTVYRRARRRAAHLAHSADEMLSRAFAERRRILFEAASPMSFGLFRPIFRRLCSDRRLEFWFTAPGRTWPPEVLFKAAGVTEHVIPAAQAATWKWDLCMNTDFFEMTNLRRRTRRVHLFHGVAGKYSLDAPLEAAREIATFDCLMFPNKDRLRRYVEAGLVTSEGTVAALVGYPKADALVDGSLDRRAICAELRLDPDRPTIMYAPTWSPHSSLHSMGEQIIEGLAAARYQVIVKLHDRSYDPQPRASGGVDWVARLSRYDGHPLVRVARHPDATPLLFASDVLVTDHSSIGFEFLLLDRPLVVADCPALLAHSDINPEKVAQLRAAADVAADPGGIVNSVAHALADPARHGAVRRGTAQAFFYGAGSATDRAVQHIYALLRLPAPTADEQRATVRVTVSAA